MPRLDDLSKALVVCLFSNRLGTPACPGIPRRECRSEQLRIQSRYDYRKKDLWDVKRSLVVTHPVEYPYR